MVIYVIKNKKIMEELTPEQRDKLFKALLQRKEQLAEQISRSSQSSRPVTLDQQAFGRVSRGDALQQQSMAKAGLAQSQRQLRKVLQAIERYDTGDYGYCLDCGQSVQIARLEIRPETSFCFECQSKKEASS